MRQIYIELALTAFSLYMLSCHFRADRGFLNWKNMCTKRYARTPDRLYCRQVAVSDVEQASLTFIIVVA